MSLRTGFLAVAVVLALTGCSPDTNDLVDPVDAAAAAFPVVERLPAAAGTRSDLHAVWTRPDLSEAWFAGSGGTILHFRNGALHRDPVVPQQGTDWRGLAFSNGASRGTAVGSDGQVAEYLTDQDRWIPRPTGAPMALNSIWLSDTGLQGYAAGAGGTLLQLAGTSWSRIAVDVSPAPYFADVAANAEYVWARDSVNGSIYVVARPEHRLLGILPGFVASKTWATSTPPALWRAGIRLPARNEIRYSIIRRQTAEDTIDHVPFIPVAVAMSSDGERGLTAGYVPNAARHDSTFYGFVTRRRTYAWPAPRGEIVEALAATPALDSGWVVGRRDLLARYRLQPLMIQELSWTHGKIGRLTGRYRLLLAPGSPPRSLDSLSLSDPKLSYPLIPGRDFDPKMNRGDTLEFEFTPTAQERAERLYVNKEVTLRLFVRYTSMEPGYPVTFVKREPFMIGEMRWYSPFWKWLRAVPGWAWLATVVILAILIPPVRKWVLDPDSGMGAVAAQFNLAVKHIPIARWRVLRPHTRLLEDQLTTGDFTGTIRVIDPGRIRPRNPAEPLSTVPMLYGAARGRGVVWLEDAARRYGRLPLEAFAREALARRRVPILIALDKDETIREKLASAWDESNVRYHPDALLAGGGYLLLVDCVSTDQPDRDALQFINSIRGSNLVVVCSSAPPPSGRGFTHATLS